LAAALLRFFCAAVRGVAPAATAAAATASTALCLRLLRSPGVAPSSSSSSDDCSSSLPLLPSLLLPLSLSLPLSLPLPSSSLLPLSEAAAAARLRPEPGLLRCCFLLHGRRLPSTSSESATAAQTAASSA
jgi:hypothetical protein